MYEVYKGHFISGSSRKECRMPLNLHGPRLEQRITDNVMSLYSTERAIWDFNLQAVINRERVTWEHNLQALINIEREAADKKFQEMMRAITMLTVAVLMLTMAIVYVMSHVECRG